MLPVKPTRLALLVFLFLWCVRLQAQSDPSGAKRVTDTFVITNATLIPNPGTIIANQDILIKKGLIAAVGQNINIPAEAEVIVGDSLFVYPGFIDMASKTGITNPPTVEKPSDFDPSNPPDGVAGIHPQVRALDYYDASHTQNADWRKTGFTLAQKLPMGQGMLPGITGVVVYGDPKQNTIISENVAVYAKFTSVGGMYPATGLGLMAKFRNLYENARLLNRHTAIFTSNQAVPLPEKNPVLEALIPVTQKETPLLFEVAKELDIRRVLNLQNEFGFNAILLGITEGENLIAEIKRSGAGVALNLNLPEEKTQKADPGEKTEEFEKRVNRIQDAYAKQLSLASAFEKAGVPFAFTTKHLSPDKLFSTIRLMIAHGLSEEGALAALTIHPARLLGIERIAGDISKGKMANLVITTDSLFKEDSQIKYVIAHGQLYKYDTTKKEGKQGQTTHWEYETKTSGGSSRGSFRITENEGKYSGNITIDDPEQQGLKTVPLEEIKVTPNSMSFSFKVKASDQELLVQVEGEVDAADFQGKLSIVGYESFPFAAKKTEEKPKK